MSKVLVVDDNQANRRIARLVLEDLGYIAIERENGKTCLEALKQEEYSLLILDLEMPEMAGAEVLAYIRKSEKWKHLPVIVVTANHHMIQQEIEDAADYILLKPIDVLQLRHLIKRLFGN
jgi:two-component system, chemotaxis family, chemotaxis protein CheY